MCAEPKKKAIDEHFENLIDTVQLETYPGNGERLQKKIILSFDCETTPFIKTGKMGGCSSSGAEGYGDKRFLEIEENGLLQEKELLQNKADERCKEQPTVGYDSCAGGMRLQLSCTAFAISICISTQIQAL